MVHQRRAGLLSLGFLGLGLLAGGCNTPPPRPWLRYEPAGPTEWTTDATGRLGGLLFGCPVAIDLNRQQTKIEVLVENPGNAKVEFRMGPEAVAARSAIGEVLLRPLSGPPGIGGPPMQPYTAMQPLVVEPGWRGTFYLDTPLGRDAVLGQYFVFTVEARDGSGQALRRTLPLVATNAGTTTADGS